jgi:hypothetical protein
MESYVPDYCTFPTALHSLSTFLVGSLAVLGQNDDAMLMFCCCSGSVACRM